MEQGGKTYGRYGLPVQQETSGRYCLPVQDMSAAKNRRVGKWGFLVVAATLIQSEAVRARFFHVSGLVIVCLTLALVMAMFVLLGVMMWPDDKPDSPAHEVPIRSRTS